MATNDQNNGILGGTGESTSATIEATSSGDTLVLPNGLNPATADYAHDGPDLVLTWPDGSEVVVTDYFMVDPQPALASEQGAEVPGDLAARLAGPATPGMVAQAGAEGVAEQPIGQVEKLAGTVTAIRADGTRVELQLGDPVYQGDILETDADGAVGIILADETTFSMAEEGRMVLDEMVYDPGTQEGSVSLSVMQGVFTFVSGQAAKTDPDAMTLHTPVATIGIRGTQVGLDLSDGQNLDIVLMEEADGFVGEVVVMNNAGVTVLNGANEFTVVTSFNAVPVEPIVIETPQMIGTFSNALRHLPLQQQNVNDFGLQGETVQGGAEGLADFETAVSEDLSADVLNDFDTAAGDIEAEGLADFETAAGDSTTEDTLANFDTAAGSEDQGIDGNDPITVAVDAAAEGFVVVSNTQGSGSSDPDPTPTPPETPPTDDPQADPSVGEPAITVQDAVTNEDGSVGLNITVSTTEADDTISSITISGVPDKVTLSAGTDNGNGTWTLTPDQLSGLTLTPDADYSAAFNLTVSATAADGTLTATNSDVMSVTVNPVADAPTLSATAASGNEDTAIALNISTAETDVDGSEVLSMTISGVPAGATLSAGTKNTDGTWTLDPATDLAGLTLTPPTDYNGSFNLTVTSTSTDTLGNVSDSASTTTTLNVTVNPVADAPTLTVGNVTSPEDGTVTLDIGVSGAPATSITITGVPAGATLSAGTYDAATGAWTLTPAQLTGLTLTPVGDFSGTFDLSVTATGTDGSTSTGTAGISVTPVVDTGSVSGAASGAEDSAIALNITAAVGDTDGSEAVTQYTITNIPAGATLSAGTVNADGSVTLTPAQLSGLTITPPSNFSGTFNLGVTAQITDTAGNLTDVGSASGTIGVNVTPVVDTGSVSGTASGAEDSAIALNITAAVGDTDGSEAITQYVISSVPTGATLSAGTDNGNGTWTLSPAQLTGLTVTPPADYSGTFNLGITAQITDTAGNLTDTGTATGTIAVNVTPVADAPTLDTAAASGNEDTAIALSIATAETDVDGSEVLSSVEITGVPAGATLSAGTYDAQTDTWSVPVDQLGGLTLTPPANYNGTFTLGVKSTSTDTLGNVSDSASTTGTIDVTVNAVPDTPIVTTGTASGNEDSAIGLSISAAGVNGVAVDSVTITGVPSGATLSAGTVNADGSVTLTPAQLSGLTITPPADYSGSFDLNVTATAADGSTASGVATVGVNPVADAPTLSASTQGGDEDTAIALNIATAETDVDGSEVLSMVISGVPSGATLSAGTKNADGTWSLDPATDLAGLTITPPANFNGSFDLTVTSTSTDTLGNVSDSASTSTAVTVNVAPVDDKPSLTLSPSTGAEDSTGIALNIGATGTGGVDVASVTITGVPSGATLSAGTYDAATGAWTVAPGDLAGLNIVPPADYSGSFDLSVKATAADGSTTTGTVNVGVTPVADAPTLDTAAASGNEDTAIALSIATAETDVDGSEVLSSVEITGVPAGATLSAGTYDAQTDTWSVPVDQLGGLTLTPPANYNGTFTLGVKSTSTDTLGNVSDSASTTGTIDVTVNAVPDTPIVTTGTASGNEDSAIGLSISAAGVNGVAVDSVTITGVPSGATLSAGTVNADGSVTLTPAQLSGLTITPPADYSGSFDLNVTATAADGSTASGVATVGVNPVADAPTLSASTQGGDEDTAIALNIATAETDVDGSEVLSMVISGVPSGATLSAGTKNADGTWSLDPATDLAGLTITPPANFNGSFDLTVTSTSTDTLGNVSDSASTSTAVTVNVAPVDDKPSLTLSPSTGAEDSTGIALNIGATGTGGVDVASVTITGVPSGATLSAGTYDAATGAWTVAPGDLAGLNIVPPADYSGSFDLSVKATAADGSTTTGTVNVGVTPVVDTGSVSGTATGAEDSAIAIDITASVGDTDGSEAITQYTITNIPAGATLSAGTVNPDGSVTLTPDQLAGLTITPPQNYNGTFDLGVTAQIVDTAGNLTDVGSASGTIGVNVTPVVDTGSVSGTASGAEDSAIAIDITASVGDTDGSEAITQYVISSVPTGASLSAGTDNGDGTWTLTPDQLTGLTITPPSDFSGTFNLGVTAQITDTAGNLTDTGTATGTIGVNVTPVVDTGSVSGTATGAEDSAIAIDITASVGDTDGSEAITQYTITNIPAGATLSAGTVNPDGSVTLTPDQLAGLTITPPQNYNGTFDLGVTAQIVDTAGNLTDVGSASGTIGVNVTAVDDAPDVGGTPASGLEDNAIALDITATPTDGVAVDSITISNIPTGATLSAGTVNPDGSVTLSPDQLAGLTITPPLHYSGNFDLNVTAVSADGGTTTATTNVAVEAVADAPTLTLSLGQPTGTEGFLPDIEPMPHDISNIVMYLQNSDGSIDKVKVEDFPGGGLNDVNDLGIEAFMTQNYPNTTLVGLTVKAGSNHTPGYGPGEGELVYVAPGMTEADLPVAAHVDGADTYTYANSLDGLPPSSTGAGDLTYPVNITTALTDADGSEVLSVVVTGVPAGVTLSAGTDNGDGTWDVATGDLSGLTMTVPEGTAAFTLGVTSTSTEQSNQDAASTTATAQVDGVATDLNPSVDSINATGNEDTTISLDITVSNAASVTITNIPTGGTLSAGTDNGDGSWTLTPDQLTGLTFTPAEHWSGSFDIGVTATAADGEAASDVSTVDVIAVADAPNLTLDIGVGTQTGGTGGLSLQNMGQESAGYENTIGWYRMDESGNPVEGGVIWSDTKQDIGDTFTMDNVDPSTIGFFIVSDGGTQNPGLSNGEPVSFQQDGNGAWQVIDSNGDVLQSASGGGTFFTNTALNPNGFDYEQDSGAIGNMNWEDLTGGGDNDFNDVNLNLTTQAGSPSTVTYPVDITTSLVDTDGSETLSLVVSGVPNGAHLSAGTDNGDGTWTLDPAADLTGLTLTVPASVTEDFSLTATATATEPNGHTASTTASDLVDIPDVADPTVTIGAAGSGNEDTAIPLDITVTDASSVTIANLPSGATLSAGTDNGDGTWTLSPAQLDGLTMTPAEHFSGSSDMTVTATNSVGVTASATSTVEVIAVADAPTLTVELGTGVTSETSGETPESTTVFSSSFDSANGFVDQVDGWGTDSDAIEVWQSTSGHTGEGGYVELNDDACDIYDDAVSIDRTFDTVEGHVYTVTFDYSPRAGYDADVNAFAVKVDGETVAELAPNGSNNSDNVWQSHTITFTGTGEPMNLEFLTTGEAQTYGRGIRLDNIEMTQTAPAETESSTEYPLDISSSLVDQDGSETLSLVVSGVPDGATLSAGTDNGDGTWTLTPAQLPQLTLTVDDSVTTDFNLSVSATATEPNGDTATVTQTVAVDVPDQPETPSVSVGDAASGDEDTAIALDISVTAASSVTIANVPNGATLSAGTDNGDGTWTLTPGQLDGLTITPAEDYSGQLSLNVTASGDGGQSGSMAVPVTVVGVADAPTLNTAIGDVDVSSTAASSDLDYDDIDFGAGAGKDAGKDEYEEDLSNKKDDEWVGDSKANDVDGENGEDVLAGKGGADDIEGGGNSDLIFGGSGDDNLEGDEGNDYIFGGSGNNEIDGGSGHDFIISGDGNDDIEGGSGNDVIFAGGGNNKVDGGDGTDTMVFSGAREEYLFTAMGDGQYVVEHLNGGADGVNLVEDIEVFQFMDGQFSLNDMAGSNPADELTLTYDITIETGLTDTDGSETLSDVTISGIPNGASFSAGTDNGDGTWTLGGNDLDGLTLQVDDSVNQDFSLTVSVTSTEANGDTATSTSSIDVVLPDDVTGGGEGSGGDTSADALDPLAAMFEDSDTLTFEGEEYDISELTAGDSSNDYGGLSPLGTKKEMDDYDPADNDTSDGYTSTDDGSGGPGGDIE